MAQGSLNILYLHQYFCPPGGRGNDRSFALARAWVAAGHTVQVVTTLAEFPEHLKPHHGHYSGTIDGINVLAYPVSYAQQMGYGRRLVAFLRFSHLLRQLHRVLTSDYDIIYGSSTPPTVAAAAAQLARRWGAPWVMEVVDVWPDVPLGMGIAPSWVGPWLHSYTDRLYRSAAHVVALSEGMKESITARGIAPSHLTVSPNGTDCHRFTPRAEPLPPVPFQMVYAGALGRANGVHLLLEALAQLERMPHLPDWHFTIRGWGALKEQLQSQAAARGIQNLTWADPLPKQEMPHELQRYHLGVVTFSPHKVLETNSANKFYDYLATGLPVVVNYDGWQAEVLAERQCGLSLQNGSLAENLAWCVQHPDVCQLMGARGRALAQQQYHRPNLAQQLLDVFEQVRQAPQRATLP